MLRTFRCSGENPIFRFRKNKQAPPPPPFPSLAFLIPASALILLAKNEHLKRRPVHNLGRVLQPTQ
jgi:hypothetical protein